MKTQGWLIGMQSYTLRLHGDNPAQLAAFNGTLEIPETELIIAFSGLAEFWQAVENLRAQVAPPLAAGLVTRRETAPAQVDDTEFSLDLMANAANEAN